MKVAILCAYCGEGAMKEAGAVNRSTRLGAPLYCGRDCSGKARRVILPASQRKAEKAEYDRRRREELADQIKAEKAAYHKRTYDPAKAREQRKAKMPRHVEYCRRPEYRKWKAGYDQKYRAGKLFGDFGEAAIILNAIESEVRSRATRTEIAATNGTLNKWIQRRRDYERQTDRR